ncbi:flagellar basal body P-ring formation chaperone FlgA [Psychromonas aquimarina]|uniref:flagellar basal body P-ring formation chaperone FlgA n=1 Tax=Psychromonas aquimarina TaxID=444919 RepID=UPI00041B8598|nr:flagellar basal body P-ring formation chaperone FlgA [Psychromonas aquimarina]
MLKRFIFLFLSLGCSYTFADTNYRKDIENFAESLVFDKYGEQQTLKNDEKLYIKAAPLDKRRTFSPCISDLKGEITGSKVKKKTSIKVTCPDPESWTTYVRVKVKVLVPSVVADQPLSKGQVLNKTNIKLIYIDKSQIRNGSFSQVNLLFGTRLKRNISLNKVIKNRDICFVCKNDKVTINAIKNGLSIKASGIALNDANIGTVVRVKNSRTQRIIVGTVSGLKEVQVSF